MLNALRRSRQLKEAARVMATTLVAQARQPEFFTRLGVADTTDGRFDLVALHVWLVLERLDSNSALAQALINEIFLQFDEALRHLGTGDVGMNHRLKALAGAFYGRLQAYRSAATCEDLAEAIRRNVYRGAPERTREAEALAAYAMDSRSLLRTRDVGHHRLDFAPLPII